MTPSRLHRPLAIGSALVVVVTLLAGALQARADRRPAAPDDGVALLRVAQLAAGSPVVDVTLTAFDGGAPRSVEDLAYGDTSGYRRVPAGLYTVVVRRDGARGRPVIDSTVEVSAGGAFTFAFLGRGAERRSVLLEDDLTLPDGDQATVRFVNAGVRRAVALRAVGGATLAADIGDGDVSEYAPTPAGQWLLEVRAQGRRLGAGQPIQLLRGTVNTLVATRSPNGVRLVRVVDARSPIDARELFAFLLAQARAAEAAEVAPTTSPPPTPPPTAVPAPAPAPVPPPAPPPTFPQRHDDDGWGDHDGWGSRGGRDHDDDDDHDGRHGGRDGSGRDGSGRDGGGGYGGGGYGGGGYGGDGGGRDGGGGGGRDGGGGYGGGGHH